MTAGTPIKAVISDFGGVLTTPLLNSFGAIQDEIGIDAGALGRAMQRIAERDGEHPLYELERGRISETEFLEALRRELAIDLGHEPELHRFADIYFEALDVNEPMIGVMRKRAKAGMTIPAAPRITSASLKPEVANSPSMPVLCPFRRNGGRG